jgi:putative thioredoxin
VSAETVANWIYDVRPEQFARLVLQRSQERPVVVDFWAPWCPPCRALGPLLERLVRERRGEILLAKVNVDEAPELALQYGAEAIPLVVAFRDGRPVGQFLGLLPEEQIRQFLEAIGPTEADRLARQAQELEQKNPAEAERLYRQALAADARHEAATVGLARLLVARGQDDEARQLLAEAAVSGERAAEVERLNGLLALRQLAQGLEEEATLRRRLEAEPANAELRYQLGVRLAAAGRYEEALQLLLAAAEASPSLARSKARPAMIQIFNVIGPQSPLANDYRNRLMALLY